MSEYQYYEFLAIDRPLTAKEMTALRTISSRARITPSSFTNHYQWGDFKGNPRRMMKLYFDAHVYVTNWMTALFMVRLPREAFSVDEIGELASPGVLELEMTDSHWLITWRLEEAEDDERFGLDDGRRWMARLSPVREELLRGDLRSLYIGWLAAVSQGLPADDEIEPLVPEGLDRLTPAQRALAKFLEVDRDLLAGAARGIPSGSDDEPLTRHMDEWIAQLPAEELRGIVKQLLESDGRQITRTLRIRFAAWRRDQRPVSAPTPERQVKELRANAEWVRTRRLEKHRRARQKEEKRQQEQQDRYLRLLARDFPAAWRRIGTVIEGGSASAYDSACQSLVDLSAAYARHASGERFQQELEEFLRPHHRRRALIRRLVSTGLWTAEG